jgi:hypothetical protein
VFGTDQSHFRKYLATLGVAIVVASLSLGGYVLQLGGDLGVTVGELANLTETARDVVAKRQNLLFVLTAVAPFLMIVGTIGGLLLSVFGLSGWYKHQVVLDRRSLLENEKLSYEVGHMTSAEKERKIELGVPKTPDPAQTSSVDIRVRPYHDESVDQGPAKNRDSSKDLYRNIELTVIDKLKEVSDGITWSPSVRITSPAVGRFFADVVGYRNERIERVLEIKLVSNAKVMNTQLLSAAVNLSQLSEATGTGQATLLLVAREAASLKLIDVDRVSDLLSGLSSPPRVVAMAWDELKTMSPSDLHELVAGPAA